MKKWSLIIWFGMLWAFWVFSCMNFVIHAQEKAESDIAIGAEAATTATAAELKGEENIWRARPWLGQYVMIQPVQISQQLPDGRTWLTGKQMDSTYTFLTLKLIMKERDTIVQLQGREDPKRKLFVNDFDTHCTPEGLKLALLIKELKVPIGKASYPAVRNLIASWDSIRVTWRSFFSWDQNRASPKPHAKTWNLWCRMSSLPGTIMGISTTIRVPG